MSNALAVAAVTALLKDLLDNGLIDYDLPSSVGAISVTARPPDRIAAASGGQAVNQLNLFLYQVTPNPGWRNVGSPSRDARGERISNPPLALDLHYLLTAYGADDLNAEILLGYAMQVLHENPVLSREAIRKALAASSVKGDILPPALQALSAAELAGQAEQIKITPASLSTEEISKLWAAFQTPYRPTVAYQVSVVLIESARPTRTPLPVLTRGAADQGVFVQPNTTPAFPMLEELLPPNRQPSARLGDVLTLRGHHLDGDSVRVSFQHRFLDAPRERAILAGGSASEITVRMPKPPEDANAPDNWPAGFYTIAAVIRRAGKEPQTSNELPLALAPQIMNVPLTVARDAQGAATLSLTCQPYARPEQRISVILGEREVLAAAHPKRTPDLTFPIAQAVPGEYYVRLRVDGVESLLVVRSQTPPRFDDTQKVTIT